MRLYGGDGEYEFNLSEDWKDFVQSVKETMAAIPDTGFCNWTYMRLIAKQVGALDLADVERAIEEVRKDAQ